MRFNPDNFLYMLKNIVTGKNGGPQNNLQARAADGGVKVDRPALYAASTATLTDSTTGTASTVNAVVDGTATYSQAITNANNATLARAINSLAAGGTVLPAGASLGAGSVRFVVPRDYDEASDDFGLYIFVALAAADANITMTATATVRSLGQAPVAKSAVNFTLPFTTAAAPLSTTEQALVANLSGLGLKRNDIVTIALATVGTTTGTTTIYATQVTFDSCVVSFNETDAAGIGSAFKGNPLR